MENKKWTEAETPGPNQLAKPQGFHAHSFPAGIWPAPSSIFVLLNKSLSPSSSLFSPMLSPQPSLYPAGQKSCCHILMEGESRPPAALTSKVWGSSQQRMLGSLTQHMPWILKIISWVPSNGKSLPFLESVHLRAEKFISILTTEFFICVQSLCALMLHAWIHEDKRRVWEHSQTNYKHSCKCACVFN